MFSWTPQTPLPELFLAGPTRRGGGRGGGREGRERERGREGEREGRVRTNGLLVTRNRKPFSIDNTLTLLEH